MKPLDVRSRALLERARPAEDPSDADRARVRARVLAKLAGAGVAAAALTEAGTAAAAASTGAAATGSTGVAAAGSTGVGAGAGAGAGAVWGIAKAVLVGSVAGLLASGAVELAFPIGPTAAVPRPAVVAVAPAASGSGPSGRRDVGRELTSSGPSARVAARDPAESGPAAAGGPAQAGAAGGVGIEPRGAAGSEARAELKGSGTASVRDEVSLLIDAHQAILHGQTDQAMALLDRHERQYRGGAMTEERLAARAIALCTAGREPEAKVAAARFFAEAKGSQLAERVKAACAHGAGAKSTAGAAGAKSAAGAAGESDAATGGDQEK